jgi:hypothetical protein
MRKLIAFVCLIAFPLIAEAQNAGWQQPNPAGTPRALPTPGTPMNRANVDTFGNQLVSIAGGSSGLSQSVIPISNATGLNGVGALGVGASFIGVDAVEAASTTTVLNLTAHVARVGDILSFRTGTAANVGVWSTVSAVTANTVTLSNALPATPAAADAIHILRPEPISVNPNNGNSIYNSLNVAIDSNTQVAAASGLLKLEDAAAASGDALVAIAGRVNSSGSSIAADGDYTTPSLDALGQNFTAYNHSFQPVAAQAFTKAEDAVHGSGDAGVAALGVIRSALSAVAAVGDYSNIQLDEVGRLITTLAPAGESWQACTGSITDTTQTAIKAAVASNRIYVTSFGCNNTAAVASTLVFQDGASAIWQGAISNSTLQGVASYSMTFPVPLRGTVNTALNVTLGTTATNTRCCASGYISVN